MTKGTIGAVVLLWMVVLFGSLFSTVLLASEGGPFCSSDHYRSPLDCYDCACVGHCYCMNQVGIEMCTFDGRLCYFANKINVDGGPSNCHYICCVEYNWDCELP